MAESQNPNDGDAQTVRRSPVLILVVVAFFAVPTIIGLAGGVSIHDISSDFFEIGGWIAAFLGCAIATAVVGFRRRRRQRSRDGCTSERRASKPPSTP